MAGKISAKNAVILIDDSGGTPRDLSGDCDSFEIEQDAGKIEVTGFGEGSKNYIPGMPVKSVTFNFKWNSLSTSGARTVLQGIYLSTTSKTVSVTPEVGGQSFSGEFMLANLPVKGTPDGDLQLGTVKFEVMGATAPTWA
jgi:hypothetical protein